jgi:acyl carrier protein
MSDPITVKVIGALARVKRIPEEKIALDSSLADLGFDSLDTITMLFELEKQFDISIADEEVRSVRSVRDIVEGVRRYVTAAPAVRSPASSD